MKKIIIILGLIFLTGCQKNIAIITPKDNLVFPFLSEVYPENLITIENGEFLNTEAITTTKLGENVITIDYKDTKNHKGTYEITYTIIDTNPPLLNTSKNIYVNKNTSTPLSSLAFYGDYEDPKVTLEITGSYDVSTIGNYPLNYTVFDSSGNKTSKDVILHVIEPQNKETTIIPDYLLDIQEKYKSNNTEIGIDVSSHQKDIDWQKVKDGGVNFVMIRVGYGPNKELENILDSYFYKNINGAKEVGLNVGLYFYSYATTKEEIIESTNWLIDKIDTVKLDLPIAFDWESWKNYGTYNLSFYELNNLYQTFKDMITNAGYQSMLYSSKYYLNNIWNIDDETIWLAHYTTKTDYKGNYMLWQLTDTGIVDGIDSYVDINILYK